MAAAAEGEGRRLQRQGQQVVDRGGNVLGRESLGGHAPHHHRFGPQTGLGQGHGVAVQGVHQGAQEGIHRVAALAEHLDGGAHLVDGAQILAGPPRAARLVHQRRHQHEAGFVRVDLKRLARQLLGLGSGGAALVVAPQIGQAVGQGVERRGQTHGEIGGLGHEQAAVLFDRALGGIQGAVGILGLGQGTRQVQQRFGMGGKGGFRLGGQPGVEIGDGGLKLGDGLGHESSFRVSGWDASSAAGTEREAEVLAGFSDSACRATPRRFAAYRTG